MPASDSFFLDAGRRDYRLAPDSKAVDAGVMLAAVALDRLGHTRPSGGRWDVGAYEVSASGR
jgi:hypothetical protein